MHPVVFSSLPLRWPGFPADLSPETGQNYRVHVSGLLPYCANRGIRGNRGENYFLPRISPIPSPGFPKGSHRNRGMKQGDVPGDFVGFPRFPLFPQFVEDGVHPRDLHLPPTPSGPEAGGCGKISGSGRNPLSFGRCSHRGIRTYDNSSTGERAAPG
jgi:hypothetical protein